MMWRRPELGCWQGERHRMATEGIIEEIARTGEAPDTGVGTVGASEVIQRFEMTEVPLTDVRDSRYLFGVRGF